MLLHVRGLATFTKVFKHDSLKTLSMKALKTLCLIPKFITTSQIKAMTISQIEVFYTSKNHENLCLKAFKKT